MIRNLQEDVLFQMQCHKEDPANAATLEFFSNFCEMRSQFSKDTSILSGVIPLKDPLLFDRELILVWRKIDDSCYAFVIETHENAITASNILTLFAHLVEESRRHLLSSNKSSKFIQKCGFMLNSQGLDIILKYLVNRNDNDKKVDLLFQTRSSSKSILTKIINELGTG
eukprot:GDKK01056388.1.p1 GENE.GDKK01056388.1~~GDKK01056388.1.p1  ORF type:complete len:169 (+),score=15.99 GDKK01056388.1:203-709(+)